MAAMAGTATSKVHPLANCMRGGGEGESGQGGGVCFEVRGGSGRARGDGVSAVRGEMHSGEMQ